MNNDLLLVKGAPPTVTKSNARLKQEKQKSRNSF